MLSLTFILANIKVIVLGVAAVIAALFGANYVRRGKKIDKLNEANVVHEYKNKAEQEQIEINKDTKEKLDEVDNAKSDDVLDKLNDLDK